MAATDQTYRSQYGLDIVFAVSSILMLLSIVWMLVDDYHREYKTEQRQFRDVEVAMAQREALDKIPSKANFDEATNGVETARKERDNNRDKIDDYAKQINLVLPQKEQAEWDLTGLKANYDSKNSFYDIAEESNRAAAGHGQPVDSSRALALKAELADLSSKMVEAKINVEKLTQEIKELQRKKDGFEQPLTVAVGKLKKVLDAFDRQVALAIKKKWNYSDIIRSLPVIDGFASPTKIEQITLTDLTIDYNFKGVTRFDRCTTCHKGIAKPTFTKANLADLCFEPSEKTDKQLKDAKDILAERNTILAGLPEGRKLPDPNQLTLTLLSDHKLTPARISEFSAHPRLDLFVGPNSKHPMEKFGCTICHSGQPSGTSFTYAAHTPNNEHTAQEWRKEHDWEAQHMWDYPMFPKRFTESSCLKCHHNVTDLYSDGNKTEAPQLLKGYNLIREFGCFGCHEINGYKGGRPVGPDLRLEPHPPLEQMEPAKRATLMADPDNPPGTMRKIAPSLNRISEKTNEQWALKWLRAPREFRPDTKMPHYYGLANNDEEALKGTPQEKFPDTEIQGIVHFLFEISRDYVSHADIKLNEKLAEYKGNPVTGRDLFSKKGCLACHSHAATNEPDEKWPAIPSEADFGPNLTQVKEKLASPDGDLKHGRIWLTNWLKNPTVHSPRTRMPVTHLTDQEAGDIAAWLLDQDVPVDAKTHEPSIDLRGPNWKTLKIAAPTDKDLADLAQVYLVRTLAQSEVTDLYEGKLPKYRVKDLGADEREFADLLDKAKSDKQARRDAFLHFAGKKAVGRLGCYGCHDIPGFESAKPIGAALADWGKKAADRLAFDNIDNYVNDHFNPKTQVVDKLVDKYGEPLSVAKGPLYERFFYDALMHHNREGFLHQKLMEPRSYDYKKILAWDDRSRMPQFKLGRVKMKPVEDPADFNLRKQWAEATNNPLGPKEASRKPESNEDFLARKGLVEAKNREAVMTFVLGLLADPIPLHYLNTPTPDRLAEIKGRQVLDKFNCAGCHVLRPGVYEFNLTPGVSKSLQESYAKNLKDNIYKDDYDDHFFIRQRAWYQPAQKGPVALTHAVRPLLSAANKKARVNVLLTEALNIQPVIDGKDMKAEFRSKDLLSLAPTDFIWPPPGAFKTTDSFAAWDREHGAQGGAFGAILGNYLKDETYPEKKKYVEPGPAVPPLLLWQGERVQPDWLFQFLLDPHKIREQTVLRMPKFNMSEDDARTLVNYFAAIEKHFNPDIDLVSPYPKVPQRADLDSEYWKKKTSEYVTNLDPKSDQYKKEVDVYKGVWEKMIKDWQAQAKSADERKKEADEALKKVKAKVADAKDDKQKAVLQKDVEQAELNAGFWNTEKFRLDTLVKTKSLKALQDDWNQTEAYALAGFRLVVNQCNKCHAVSNLQAQQVDGQGPSLNLAAARLRPEWTARWVANPQRFVPYNSAMPAYFKKSDKAPLIPWFPADVKVFNNSKVDRTKMDAAEANKYIGLQQIEAARDTVLNLDRISELPLTRYWMQSGGK